MSQDFGEDWKMKDGRYAYQSMGINGHNGLDYAVPVGTPVYAPFEGIALFRKDKDGYGNHIKIRNPLTGWEVVLGHLVSFVEGELYRHVYQGDLVGYSGNSGFSTAAHLHEGFRKFVIPSGDVRLMSPAALFGCPIDSYDNGFLGYRDISEFLLYSF